tara:strand:- start:77 stop:289 length:213 start_codon:yes stop_codon:yes gene_type:complete
LSQDHSTVAVERLVAVERRAPVLVAAGEGLRVLRVLRVLPEPELAGEAVVPVLWVLPEVEEKGVLVEFVP